MNLFKLITTFLLLSICSYSFGQFGGIIKKPKNPSISTSKNNKSKNKSSKSKDENTKTEVSEDTKSLTNKNNTSSATTSSTPTESNRNKDGTPKYDPENPTYKAYSKAKQNLKYAQSETEGVDSKIKYLEKAKTSLDLLNTQESEKSQGYLKDFNEIYTTLTVKYTASKEKRALVVKHRENLKQYYHWVSLGTKMTDETLEPNYKSYYKYRDAFKKAYPDEFEGSYEKKMVTKIDQFFKVEVYKKVETLEKDVAVIIRKIHRVNDATGKKRYILYADDCLKFFDEPIKSLTYYKKDLLEDLTTANTLEAKINKEKDRLNEYINSGDFAKNKAIFQQELIDDNLLRKGMSDSKLEAFAKSKLPAEYGKVLRVTVASTDWGINKNVFDIPVSKGITLDFATKKEDDKCYYVTAFVMQNYKGGGQYGDWYFTDPWERGEMNCNNINKNQ